MNHVHENHFEPASFLVENIDLLPRGRALDIAMGNGRNAIYLAEMGFDVKGIDKSPEAVAQAREMAQSAGVSMKAEIVDLEADYHIERGAYDVIICFHYLQRSLIPQIKNAIRKGGMVVYETFIVDQAQWGKPKNPDYLLKHNELIEMFGNFRCLRYREGIVGNGENRQAIAGIVAEKV